MAHEMPTPQQPTETPRNDWRDRLNETARDLSGRTRELVEEGNSRRLVIEQGGRTMVNLPLTLAAVLGGVTVLAAPAVAVLGAIAALMARVRVRVEPENRG